MKKINPENFLKNWCVKNNKTYLLEEWDYSKNGLRTPENVSYASNLSFYWVCPNGHSYLAPVYRRTT